MSQVQSVRPMANFRPCITYSTLRALCISGMIRTKRRLETNTWSQVYLMTHVSSGNLQSQFRSCTYDIKISDCYSVSSTTLNRPFPGPMRGMDDLTEADSDPDAEFIHQSPDCSLLPKFNVHRDDSTSCCYCHSSICRAST